MEQVSSITFTYLLLRIVFLKVHIIEESFYMSLQFYHGIREALNEETCRRESGYTNPLIPIQGLSRFTRPKQTEH